MTGFEPQTSAVWSNRSTNWATTTAPLVQTLLTDFETLRGGPIKVCETHRQKVVSKRRS